MAARKLTLRKETLTELTDADLTHVVGMSGLSCTPFICITNDTACYSDFQECITGNRCH